MYVWETERINRITYFYNIIGTSGKPLLYHQSRVMMPQYIHISFGVKGQLFAADL